MTALDLNNIQNNYLFTNMNNNSNTQQSTNATLNGDVNSSSNNQTSAPSSTPLKKITINDVPGLTLYPEYITPNEETDLWKALEAMPWCVDFSRKLQYYGYRNELEKPYSLVKINNEIPSFLQTLRNRIMKDKIANVRPDQVIINDYEPGQGIRPHFDRKDYFAEQILGISLGSDCVMEWILEGKDGNKKHSVRIPNRSLYVVEGEARYKYKHAISGRKNDPCDKTGDKLPRGRRISITFRKVIENKVKKTPEIFYNHAKSRFENVNSSSPIDSEAPTESSEIPSKKRKISFEDFNGTSGNIMPSLKKKEQKQTLLSAETMLGGFKRINLMKFK